jgi:hypothetical protein
MYQFGLSKQCKAIEQLLCEYPYQCGGQPAELILLDQFIQVDAQQLEYQAKMLPVNECIFQS